ncbi:MAG: aminomethyl-transferring glycine dehydrogenase [Verrucomicrobia bacterium]|nr:aminomethyl-transferring glycine dehydrogenase [Verrucomicrobiota bacterium]
MTLSGQNEFLGRHIGPRGNDVEEMLQVVGVSSLDQLIEETVPRSIRRPDGLQLPAAESESGYLKRLKSIAAKNRILRSYIGLGYYGTLTPSVILRTIFENPSWYTPYTPYQAEIAQGRLEALLNFQTVVEDLTGMPVANASLLDEATAAAEAMTMLHRAQARAKKSANVFLVSDKCFAQTLAVLRSRAEPLGIELRSAAPDEWTFAEDVFGALIQMPDDDGRVFDMSELISRAHEAHVLIAVATDLLALTLIKPPGEMGADAVVGNSQRFGVPMGFGGPHAAFFAAREEHVRQIPGRIIGVSVDAHGNTAYRMALQTREQHIRREKATSNICTAQALLATMAGMYAVYHGPEGLKEIARRVHNQTATLAGALKELGFEQVNHGFFDTLKIAASPEESAAVRKAALEAGINFRYFDDGYIGISLDETVTDGDVGDIAQVFASVAGRSDFRFNPDGLVGNAHYSEELERSSAFLAHPVFHAHRSELEMMRYIKKLERKDVGLDTSMIPLGSCTMKLTAATEMIPVSWPEFGAIHPFAPADQVQGYQQVFDELNRALCEITGFAGVSLQPNSGAQGEFAGLMVIRAYHQHRGEGHRNTVLIPSSAHGTNPASAVMAGMKVVVVACDDDGNVDVADLRSKAGQHAENLSALMITYPSTHGVFEEAIREICEIIHAKGGQVYMDGANLNAQVGLTSPALIGADVCHMNLHKTFAIPHGGGGPGMGPIAVAEHLVEFLPGHPLADVGGEHAMPAVSAAPRGSASVTLISHAYICMLGADGLREATRYAILNANYLRARLSEHYGVLYANDKGRVAHEAIFDLREFKTSGVTEEDVAKRLMDYGFHAPTVSWPVVGTMMIEPTESEPKQELDRFCEALVAIRAEIQEIVDGKADPVDNVLKNAPHTQFSVASDEWKHPYSRQKAAYPLSFVRESKFWPSIGRVDNPHGDRNLFCSCPPHPGDPGVRH